MLCILFIDDNMTLSVTYVRFLFPIREYISKITFSIDK